jgi:hypothetical protein
MIKLTPTIEEIEALRTHVPPGPVVIVNLLKFRPDGGREAYARYLRAAQAASFPGVEILHAGAALRDVAAGEPWDYVIIARYPDFAAFAGVVTHPAYQLDADAHRPAALEKTIMLVTQPGSLAAFPGG